MDSINKLVLVFLFALVASAPMVFAQAGGDKKALLKKEDTCIGRIDNLKETENFIQTKDEKVFTTKSKEVDEVIKFCKSKLLLQNQNIFDFTQRICDISYNKVAEGSEDQVYLALCKLDAASFVKSLKGEVESYEILRMVEPLELRHFEMKEYLPKNLEFRERPMMDHAQELKYKQRPMMEHYDADPLGLKNRTK